MIHTFQEIFERDLLKLRDEINLYPDEASLWVLQGEVNNSAGTLCLHLIGNLNHFIGAILGQNGYVREREREFTARDIPRSELLAGIDKTVQVVRESLLKVPETALAQPFPVEKHGQIVTTGYMLLHLVTHFNYHLGQVNYHRRLTSKL